MEIRADSKPPIEDEAQFLNAVMSRPSSVPTDSSAILFHVDAKVDRLLERVETRNDRFQEDVIRDLNQLKTKLKYENRKSTIFGVVMVAAAFVAAHFVIYGNVTSYLEKLVNQKAENEFTTEKMQTIIASQAEKFTNEKAQALIQPKIDSATQGLDAFQKMADASHLASDAIHGSYSAYQKLIATADGPDISPLAALWVDELNNLIRTYARPMPVDSHLNLALTAEDGMPVDARTLEVDRLITHLKEPDLPPGDREAISSILSSKPSSDLIEPAIKAFQHEDSIFVLATLLGHFQKDLPASIPFHDKEKILVALRDMKKRLAITK